MPPESDLKFCQTLIFVWSDWPYIVLLSYNGLLLLPYALANTHLSCHFTLMLHNTQQLIHLGAFYTGDRICYIPKSPVIDSL